MAQRIPRAGLLLAVVLLLLVPALPGKTKPKSTEKQNQDFSKFVEIPGATKVGGDQCAQCHADLDKTYRRSSHALREVNCEQCHGAGSLHLAAGGYSKESKDKIIRLKNGRGGGAKGAGVGRAQR